MKFRLVEQILDEEVLEEATLTSIENIINSLRGHPGIANISIDHHKKFYIITTSLNNKYCVPIIDLGKTTSSDYKKLRYAGNGTINKGEIYDPLGNHIGRAYYGISTSHDHYDYDNVNIFQYGKYPAPNGNGISLSTFLTQANNKQI